MKKRKHFYQSRIRALSLMFCFLIAGLLTAGFVNAQGPVGQKAITIAKIVPSAALVAFAPLAFVKQLKDKGVYDKLDEETKKFCDELETSLNDTFKKALEGH